MIVTVGLKAKEGKEQQVIDALKEVMPMVKEEEGTLIYTLSKNTADNSLLMYEAYTDKAAFEAHLSKPYIQNILELFNDLLAEEPVITVHEKIGGIN